MRTPLTIIAILPLLLVPITAPSSAAPRQGDRHVIGQRMPHASSNTAAPSVRAVSAARRIRITENRGQVADANGNLRPEILYYAAAGGAQLYFTRDGISFVFTREARDGVSEATGASIRSDRDVENPMEMPQPRRTEAVRMDMAFVGANPALQIVTEERLGGYTNYYYAHCPDGVTHVASHGRLTYRNIYDNIDFVFTTDIGRVKYEFVVHPGGSVDDIRMRYSGARGLTFTADGGIEIAAAFGGVRESAPVTYQKTNGREREIPSTFVLSGEEVGFMVAAYDPARDLVIDPWASFFGASGEEAFYGVACDNAGNIVACGVSSSPTYPVYQAVQSTLAGNYDAVVTKFNSTMSVLSWSTYYGGSTDEMLNSVAIDSQGDIVLAGATSSSNLPTAAAFQPAFGGIPLDVFMLKLTGGGVRVWATYLGGSVADGTAWGAPNASSGGGQVVKFDASDQIYVYMKSNSTNMPITPGAFQQSLAFPWDNYLAKFTNAGTGPLQLSWGTYFGGTGSDYCGDMTMTPQGTIAIGGFTVSADLPLLHPFQSTASHVPAVQSYWDGFLAEFTTSGTLLWSTYLGGAGMDEVRGIVSDAQGALYVSMKTNSDTLPVHNAYQPVMKGADIYLCKFGPTLGSGGRPQVWSTYFGGSAGEAATYQSLALSGSRLFVTGVTGSTDLPLRYPMQASHGGTTDMLLAAFTTDGGLDWCTYYGGSAEDVGYMMCFPMPDAGVLCGYTKSTDFPVVGAYQMTNAGGTDAALLSFNTQQSPPTPPAPPTNMTATAESPTRIALAWQDNADSEYRYVLEYQFGAGSWKPLVVLPANTEDIIVRNLTPQTTYRFRVKAANSLYESVWSNTAEATTPAFAGPTNLRIVQVSIDEASLAWTDNSTNETEFIVECRPTGGGWQPWDSLQVNAQSANITGLTPSTEYSFRVVAVEGATASSYSNTVTATTLELSAPSELEATARSSEDVQLRWKDNTTYETAYIVSQRQIGDVWIGSYTVSSNTTEWIVTGLSPDTEYEFRVKAVRGSYPSAWSNTAQARTLLYLPAPGTLTATLVGAAEARLDWEDKSTGESGFEIERRLEGEEWQLLLTTAANTETYTAGGLLPDTTYAFRVRAVGPNAASGWTNEVTVGTFAPPLAPVALTASATDHRSVHVTWQRGSSNEMQFDVERNSDGSGWLLVRSLGRGVFSFDDNNLQPSTTFTYRVRAVNSRGASPWSAEDTATTYAVPVPLRPIGLTAAAAGSSSIRLSWGAPSPQYQTGFEIQESRTLNEVDFARVAPDAAANATTYTRGGLAANTTYYYRIRAFNASGVSEWSAIANATTLDRDPNLPEDPFNAQATAMGMSEIRVTWEMPAGSKEDGFELEISPTGGPGDFSRIDPNPAKGARERTVTGLQANTTYWFRVRAVNTYGTSEYSNTANATTQREPMSQQLANALLGKEALFPGLENLIGTGDAEMAALRTLLGDYPRGHNEAPARALIAGWRNTYPDNQPRAAEAMERYTFFEQALGSAFHDTQISPPNEGAWEAGRQASNAPAMLSKDVGALALAWTAQRGVLGSDDPYVDAAVEDLLLPVADGAQTLLALMGADGDDAVAAFAEEVRRTRGAVTGLTSRALLSVLAYWQERMAGKYYFLATQPAIAEFADRCEQLDIGDTRSAAIAKRDAFVLGVRDRTDALALGFTPYANICTGLDAAYSISQTLAPTREIFLQRMTLLRPRLVDGMQSAIARADIPVERFLYLTSTADIAGLDPLPRALEKAGNEIFHPERPGMPGGAHPKVAAEQGYRTDGSYMSVIAADPAIDADRAALITLRERVVAADASYVLANFDALRAGGREMTAAVARAERPLFGIAPAALYGQAALQAEVYAGLARSVLLRTRRSVLSVSLADYGLAPTSQKQAALVAEIDSIIGPLDDVYTGLEDLKSGQAGSLITLPALALSAAEIVRVAGAGPTKYRLRFAVANAGGSTAAAPQAQLSLLSAGVAAEGPTGFVFGDLSAGGTAGDSLSLDIPSNVFTVTFSVQLRANGRVFVEHRTLPVPQAPNSVENDLSQPAEVILHQNHPNPFRPATTIGFTLPHAAVVTLVVTDLLGREVARLADGERHEAGEYQVRFDGSALPAGLYLYRLEAEGRVLLRRMLLLR